MIKDLLGKRQINKKLDPVGIYPTFDNNPTPIASPQSTEIVNTPISLKKDILSAVAETRALINKALANIEADAAGISSFPAYKQAADSSRVSVFQILQSSSDPPVINKARLINTQRAVYRESKNPKTIWYLELIGWLEELDVYDYLFGTLWNSIIPPEKEEELLDKFRDPKDDSLKENPRQPIMRYAMVKILEILENKLVRGRDIVNLTEPTNIKEVADALNSMYQASKSQARLDLLKGEVKAASTLMQLRREESLRDWEHLTDISLQKRQELLARTYSDIITKYVQQFLYLKLGSALSFTKYLTDDYSGSKVVTHFLESIDYEILKLFKVTESEQINEKKNQVVNDELYNSQIKNSINGVYLNHYISTLKTLEQTL